MSVGNLLPPVPDFLRVRSAHQPLVCISSHEPCLCTAESTEHQQGRYDAEEIDAFDGYVQFTLDSYWNSSEKAVVDMDSCTAIALDLKKLVAEPMMRSGMGDDKQAEDAELAARSMSEAAQLGTCEDLVLEQGKPLLSSKPIIFDDYPNASA